MGAGLTGPWALAAAVGGFTVLAFLGVPQFVLVAAAVVAFGPWTGFLYSWVGNLVVLDRRLLGRAAVGRAVCCAATPGAASTTSSP